MPPAPIGAATSNVPNLVPAATLISRLRHSATTRANARIPSMSSTARHVHYTIEQYVRIEDESSVRHGYLDGEIYAMAAGSPEHAAVLIRLLGTRLPRGCRVFTSDLRVRIPSSGLSTYPDVAVVCGGTQRAEDDRLSVVSPVLLVEVTSDSTEDYDRGEKLRHYQRLTSLRELLILSHREPHVTLHRHDATRWVTVEARAHQTIELASIAARLSVDEVYEEGFEDLHADPS